MVASHVPPTGELACNPGMCPDWGENQQHFNSQAGTQSTEPHQPGALRILKAAREKQLVTYKGAPIRLSADFSIETLQVRRDWHEIVKAMKNKDQQPRLLYPEKLSCRI